MNDGMIWMMNVILNEMMNDAVRELKSNELKYSRILI
jgi:hypothetical protein